MCFRNYSPLAELMKDDAIGEALATDADPFQYTITAQLLENQVGIYLASLKTKTVKNRLFYYSFYCIYKIILNFCLLYFWTFNWIKYITSLMHTLGIKMIINVWIPYYTQIIWKLLLSTLFSCTSKYRFESLYIDICCGIPFFRGWEWCSVQSLVECYGVSSWACQETLYTAVLQCGTCLSWTWK